MKKIFAVLMIALAMVCACKPTTQEVTPEEPTIETVPDTLHASTENMIPEQGNM